MTGKIQTIENESCRNCKFWRGDNKSDWGECHRYPPQFWSEGDTSGASFVGIRGSDWCGEFKSDEDDHA